MSELKPCPFCGGKPILNHIEPHTHNLLFNGEPIMPDYPGSWTIECCDVGMIKDTREDVVAAWNRRAPVERQAPDGFAIVPIKPTYEMCKAGNEARYNSNQTLWTAIMEEAYRAMLSAAPTGKGPEDTSAQEDSNADQA